MMYYRGMVVFCLVTNIIAFQHHGEIIPAGLICSHGTSGRGASRGLSPSLFSNIVMENLTSMVFSVFSFK